MAADKNDLKGSSVVKKAWVWIFDSTFEFGDDGKLFLSLSLYWTHVKFFGVWLLSSYLSSLRGTLSNTSIENLERGDYNPGLLAEKRERYLCATPPVMYFSKRPCLVVLSKWKGAKLDHCQI